MAIYWPTPGCKGRTFKLCILKCWDFNFCVRSSPLRLWGGEEERRQTDTDREVKGVKKMHSTPLVDSSGRCRIYCIQKEPTLPNAFSITWHICRYDITAMCTQLCVHTLWLSSSLHGLCSNLAVALLTQTVLRLDARYTADWALRVKSYRSSCQRYNRSLHGKIAV